MGVNSQGLRRLVYASQIRGWTSFLPPEAYDANDKKAIQQRLWRTFFLTPLRERTSLKLAARDTGLKAD